MLGPSAYGAFALGSSIAAYGVVLADVGMSIYASRVAPRLRNDEIPRLVSLVVISRLLTGTLCWSLIAGGGLLLSHDRSYHLLLLVVGARVPLSALDVRWVFIARDQLWKTSLWGLAGQVVYAGALFTTLRQGSLPARLACCDILVLAVPVLASCTSYIREFGRFRHGLRGIGWRTAYRESIPLGASTLLGVTNAQAANLLVGFVLGTTLLGYYAVANKVVMAGHAVLAAFHTVVTPTISRLYAGSRAHLRGFLLRCLLLGGGLGTVLAVFVYVASLDLLPHLFGPEYTVAMEVLRLWGAIWLPLVPVAMICAYSLVPCDGSREFFRSMAISTTAGLAVLFAALHGIGVMGAPLSFAVRELVMITVGGRFLLHRLRQPALTGCERS